MFKLLHLNYHCHSEWSNPDQVITLHKFSCGFIDFIKCQTDFLSVKHMNYEGEKRVDEIPYHFFKSRNKSWFIPFKTHQFIHKQKPNVVLTEGFVFPLQVLFLRWKLGKKTIIVAQHQGELPFKGLKKWFQKIADKSIDAYVFTSVENAQPWLQKKIISTQSKCFEVLSASTSIKPQNKMQSKKKLGFEGKRNFLWVGRLISIKDPITVLKAFSKYHSLFPDAKLYMIYQTEDLLGEVETFIHHNSLHSCVLLKGKIDHDELKTWYSAADYFILGSHKEGSGYALTEAMVCGCIPIVTNIPSFKKLTADGKFGFLFEKENSNDLLEKLNQLENLDKEKISEDIMSYAQKEFSFAKVSDQILDVCNRLLAK